MPVRIALRRLSSSAVLIGALLLAHPSAQAWGRDGHRVVGRLAERALDAGARTAVAELLAGEPDPTLAGIANWADEIRADRPDTAALHYVDLIDSTCPYQAERDCPGGQCAVAGIAAAAATLADSGAAPAVRRDALKLLVHLVGDLHQPLHAGPGEDRGGNRIQLRWDGRGSNLHKVWDSELLRAIDRDWRAHADRLRSLDGRLDTGSLDPADWARESCRIVATPGFVPVAARLDEAAYLARWQGTVDTRLVQAGQRLAALLNAALGR